MVAMAWSLLPLVVVLVYIFPLGAESKKYAIMRIFLEAIIFDVYYE